MAFAIRRGIMRDFDENTYQATVEIFGSRVAYLEGVPVARHLPGDLLTLGSKVAVLFFDETNPHDAVVICSYGSPPPAWLNKVMVSDDDLTPDYLGAKLQAGEGIELTEQSEGGDEKLALAVKNDSITTAKIADNAVNAEKISSGAVWGESNKELLNFVSWSPRMSTIVQVNSQTNIILDDASEILPGMCVAISDVDNYNWASHVAVATKSGNNITLVSPPSFTVTPGDKVTWEFFWLQNQNDPPFTTTISALTSQTVITVGNTSGFYPGMWIRNYTRGNDPAQILEFNPSTKVVTISGHSQTWQVGDNLTTHFGIFIAHSACKFDFNYLLPHSAVAVAVQVWLQDSSGAGAIAGLIRADRCDDPGGVYVVSQSTYVFPTGAILPLDENGEVLISWNALGANTLNLFIRVQGYFERAAK